MIITTCNECDRVVDNTNDERMFYMYEIVDDEEFCIDCYEEIFINIDSNNNNERVIK